MGDEADETIGVTADAGRDISPDEVADAGADAGADMPADETADAPVTRMTEAEVRFAERLAEDLQAVLGVGLAIDDLEIVGDGPVTIRAVVLAEGQVREIEATGETSLEAYQQLVRAAAELRLAAAWWRLVGPT